MRWIEEPAAGAEAEHPAPVLKLAKASGAAPTSAPSAGPDPATAAPDNGRANLALGFGIAALVVAAAGLVLALQGRRHPQTLNDETSA